MSIISALIGVDLGRRLKKLGEKWGGGPRLGRVGRPRVHSGAAGSQSAGVNPRPADSQRRELY